MTTTTKAPPSKRLRAVVARLRREVTNDTPLTPKLKQLAGVAADACRPKPRRPTPEWAETELRLSPLTEATAGRFDLSGRPYWRAVLAAFDDPEVEEITVMASTQLGKTLTVVIAGIISHSAQSPAPALLVTPDKESVIELRDRTYANMKATPAVRKNVPPPRLWNTRHIDLGAMRAYLGYAGARQRLRGRPCRTVICTEIDVYRGDAKGGDPVAAARERVKAFRRFKFACESSPMGEDSPINIRYDASNKMTWRCQCPHCGHRQALRFFTHKTGENAGRGGIGGLNDETGNLREPDDARNHAHYICNHGCRIEQSEKRSLIESGVWAASGQDVDAQGKVTGRPARGRRHVGFHLWSIHSDTISFGDLAVAYLEHHRDGKISEFWGNWLGLAFQPRAKMPHWEQLGRRLAAAHERGTFPREAWFLTAGCDVQEDRVYFVVRAWGDKCRSWKVDWGMLERRPGDDADEIKSDLVQLLDRVLLPSFRAVDEHGKPAANPLGKHTLRVRLAGCDANYRTLDVHNFVRRQETDRLRAIRGDHKVDPAEKYRMKVVDRNSETGELYEGGLELWGIFVNHFKQDLSNRLVAEGDERTWFVCADTPTRGKDYLRQIANEPKQWITDKKGRKKLVFAPRSHVIGVDFWDCEVYARALAEMIVDSLPGKPGWNAKAWPKPAAKKRDHAEDVEHFSARD